MHYWRWQNHGDPLIVTRDYGEQSRFLKETVLPFTGDGCLTWPFRRDESGYGVITLDGTSKIVSRLTCEAVHGAPPSDRHEAAHSCGNGHLGCVNPRHLSWKTHAGNMLDMVSHGRSVRGEKQPNSKLTEPDVLMIRKLCVSVPQKVLAKHFGVDQSCVSLIATGKTWAHLR